MLRIAPPTIAKRILTLLVVGMLATFNLEAEAVDGCKVLLCLAAPKWNDIPQCVPPVRELFRDLARGHAFPSCAMASGGNGDSSANNTWAAAPTFCPLQYTHLLDADPGQLYECDYTGAVSVTVNGVLFTRTWWSAAGQSVTEFTAAAKSQLGTWDPRFDDDYAAWSALQSSSSAMDSH